MDEDELAEIQDNLLTLLAAVKVLQAKAVAQETGLVELTRLTLGKERALDAYVSWQQVYRKQLEAMILQIGDTEPDLASRLQEAIDAIQSGEE